MKKLFIFVILALFAYPSNCVFTQSLDILDIDASQFRRVKAEIEVKAANGQPIRDLNSNQFKVVDGGIERQITSTFCEPRLTRFSLILMLDVSGSMRFRVDERDPTSPIRGTVMINSSRAFAEVLPIERSDVALMTFSSGGGSPELILDYTKDIPEVVKEINGMNRRFQGGTDYITAFLGRGGTREGIVDVAKRAKYKPIVIFFTDGAHQVNSGSLSQRGNDILNALQAANATVYYIGLAEGLADDPNGDVNSPAFAQLITSGTDGAMFGSLTDEAQISNVYQDILRRADAAGQLAPCEIEYVSDCSGGNVEITYTNTFTATDNSTYSIPDNVNPNLTVETNNDLILNVFPGENAERNVTITARNNTVTVTGFENNPNFTVIDWGGAAPPFTLQKDQARTVKVRYANIDTSFVSADLRFVANACLGMEFNSRAGYIFARDINVGSSEQGVPKTESYIEKFCNLTDSQLIVSGFRTDGANAGDFNITSAPATLAPGECMEIVVRFTPSQSEPRNATYTVITNRGNYTANLIGTGSGNPEIQVEGYSYPPVKCDQTEDFNYPIRNTGPVALNVTNVELDNNVDFELVNINLPIIVPAGGSENITVRFKPQTAGVKTTNVTFTSNSGTGATTSQQLRGERLIVELTLNITTVDFGFVCADQNYSEAFSFANTGQANSIVDVEFVSGATNFSFNPTNLTVNVGQNGNIQFDLNTSALAEGQVDAIAKLVDECGNEYNVNLTAQVIVPRITIPNQTFSATIGDTDTKVVTITNSSPVELTFDLTTDNTDYVITNPANTNGLTLVAGANLNVTVAYTPSIGMPENGKLIATGEPCSFMSDGDLIGDPLLATALLRIGNSAALIGDEVSIPFSIVNKSFLVESGAQSINALVSVDSRILEPIGIAGNLAGNRFIMSLTFPLSGNNNDEDLPAVTLRCRVKFSPGIDNSTVEVVGNPETDNNAAVVTFENGLFQITPAEAKISINDFAAAPGERVKFPVNLLDENGVLRPFHQGVSTRIRFNSSMLIPVPEIGELSADKSERIINISRNIAFSQANTGKNPDIQSGQIYSIDEIDFLALLGDSETAWVVVEQSETLEGRVVISADSVQFTLNNVCRDESGNLRLFNPFGEPLSLNVNPNPVSNSINYEINILEQGLHKLELYSTTGALIKTVFENSFNAGSFSGESESSNIPNGKYLMILTSPSETLTKQIVIMK